MNIHDLTRGKYRNMYDRSQDLTYASKVEEMSRLSYEFQSVFAKPNIGVSKLLNNIPVFLVESSMAKKRVAVPGCQCSVLVPEDRYISPAKRFDIDKWVNSKEGKKDDKDDQKKESSVTDFLGVYMFLGECDVIPRRIFIWMDKIWDYTEKNTRKQEEIEGNARALFDLVLYHEMAHALMDVRLYGVLPAPNFLFATDYPYRLFEEAYANGIALNIILDKNYHLNSYQQTFIKRFVKKQDKVYTVGLELYNNVISVSQWMGLKVLFNYDFARMLRDWWKSHRSSNLECYEGVGRRGWIAVKDRYGKWGIIELPSQQQVPGFKKYDSFWSFDDNGLCMVRLDQEHGYLYGCVNEQGKEQIPVEYEHLNRRFDNGITIAKKNGFYGAIDVNNKIVIPFNLPYEDVRGFENGRAAVKDYAGKWGVIDTTGKEIVPCTSDSMVS